VTRSVDVVIPAHNQRARLATLIPHLLAWPDIRTIIIGDDASTDEPACAIPSAPQIRHVRLARRQGPAAARAAAWAAGTAPYVLTLDTDALLDQATLATMCAALESNALLAAVQPVLRCPDGTLHNAGAAINADGTTRLLPPPSAPAPPLMPIAAGCSACALWRRAAVDRVGGWDPRLWYFEDGDLSWRLRQAGGTVALATTCTAIHSWGGTMGRSRSLQRFYRQECGRRQMLRNNLSGAVLLRQLPQLLRHELFLAAWSMARGVTDLGITRGASLLYPFAFAASLAQVFAAPWPACTPESAPSVTR